MPKSFTQQLKSLPLPNLQRFYSYASTQRLIKKEKECLQIIYVYLQAPSHIENFDEERFEKQYTQRLFAYYEAFLFIKEISAKQIIAKVLKKLDDEEYTSFKHYMSKQKLPDSWQDIFKRICLYVESAQTAKANKYAADLQLDPKYFKGYSKRSIENALSKFNTYYFPEYLVMSTLEREEQTSGIKTELLLKGYRRVNLYELWKSTHTEQAEQQESALVENWEHYWQQFTLADAQIQYMNATKDYYADFTFQPTVDAWDVQYMIKKLILLCGSHSYDILAGKQTLHPISLHTIDAILQENQSYWEQFPIIQAYYNLLKLQQTQKESYFHILDKLLQQYSYQQNPTTEKRFSRFASRQIAYVLIHYHRIQGRQGNRSRIMKKAFGVMERALEQGLLHVDGCLQINNFLLAITLALRANKIEWAETFLEQYKKDLPERQQLSYYEYGRLLVAFQKERYKEILKKLTIEGEDTLIKKDEIQSVYRRALILKCEYEQEYNNPDTHHPIDDILLKRERSLSRALEAAYNWCIYHLGREEFKQKAYIKSFQHFIKILSLLHRTDKYFREELKRLYLVYVNIEALSLEEEQEIYTLPFDSFAKHALATPNPRILDAYWLREKYEERIHRIRKQEKPL